MLLRSLLATFREFRHLYISWNVVSIHLLDRLSNWSGINLHLLLCILGTGLLISIGLGYLLIRNWLPRHDLELTHLLLLHHNWSSNLVILVHLLTLLHFD